MYNRRRGVILNSRQGGEGSFMYTNKLKLLLSVAGKLYSHSIANNWTVESKRNRQSRKYENIEDMEKKRENEPERASKFGRD